ncbi:MAG: hypothetical protein ACI9WV_001780 [Patiriisocius sp.]|jgi:hypothetical protein
MFYRKTLWDKVNGLNLNYKLAADFELWTRFAIESSLVSIFIPLSGFRIDKTSRSKKFADIYENEIIELVKKMRKNRNFIKFLSKSRIINKMIRLMIWKKQEIIFYSVSKREWCLKKVNRPISTVSFSNLILEL